MEIESIGELMYACNENRLMFTRDSEKKHRIIFGTQFRFICVAREVSSSLKWKVMSFPSIKNSAKLFPGQLISITGAFRRQLEISTRLNGSHCCTCRGSNWFFQEQNIHGAEEEPGELVVSGSENMKLQFPVGYRQIHFTKDYLKQAAVEAFLEQWTETFAKIPES